MDAQSHTPQPAPIYNGSAERSIRDRLLDALKSHHPKPLGAERLCALAGVRRMLLATAMSELITTDKAHLVCADVYGFGPIAPTARSLGKRLDTENRPAEKTCKRCTVSKARTEFYTGDNTCKSCRAQLAKDRKNGAGKKSQAEVPTDSHAERAQPPEATGGPESAPTVPHVVAGKESQQEATAPQNSYPVGTPVVTGEKPPSTDVALHIPPRKGLDCCVRNGSVILTQGDSSIEIDPELCDLVAGWIICASEDIARLLADRNAEAMKKLKAINKTNENKNATGNSTRV